MAAAGAGRLGRLLPPRLAGLLAGESAALVASSAAGFAIRAAGVALMTLVTVLFTRLMGPEEYGRLAFLLSGSFIIVLFTGLGLPVASSRLVPRYLARGDEDAAAHYLAFSVAAIAAASARSG
jgi:O-antigen/teichoic acid export membrane protein